MKIDITYGIYTSSVKVMEKAGPLAQKGDADALEVLGCLMPAAGILGGQLRRKLAVEIAEVEAKSGRLPAAAGESQPQKRTAKPRRSSCRLRAS